MFFHVFRDTLYKVRKKCEKTAFFEFHFLIYINFSFPEDSLGIECLAASRGVYFYRVSVVYTSKGH